ncbi:acyltransferase family protein [Enterobacter asburiae]|uniref:acyltransferase family protein n=2 Tax=Enterobacter asburiae TaxID=61645 RepID=UPI00143337D8|nr:acyltransferase family protein [Enterobacter asburiae]HDR2316276.1 acyltransferase family protein [Enterobacter asburiae]
MFSQNILIIWMVVLTTIIAFIFNSKYFSFLDRKDDFSNKEINGLRFFLSIGVAYHHFIFSYNYSTGKGWSIANYDIITFLGKFSVGIFFIISGYLFYNSVTSKTEWKSFFYKKIS